MPKACPQESSEGWNLPVGGLENPDAEAVFYVYCINEDGTLVGVISLRQLLLVPPSTQLKEAMNSEVISVPLTLDQEEVAASLEDESSAYRRLKLAMDAWCALWFWPIEEAELLPDRPTWLAQMELVLKGQVCAI